MGLDLEHQAPLVHLDELYLCGHLEAEPIGSPI
jgi:hypothetical protein